MCEPTTLMAASLAISAASGVAQYMAGNAAADAQEEYNAQVTKNADQAYVNDLESLRLQQLQDEKASKQKIVQNKKEAISARSRAKTAAGEGGVAGLSVAALLADFDNQEAQYKDSVIENLAARNQQRGQEVLSAQSRLSSRYSSISPVSRPSLLSTGLQIGASAIDTGMEYNRYKNPPRTNS